VNVQMALSWAILRLCVGTARIRPIRLEGMILAEAGRGEPIDILIVETSALFDHRSCQSGQRGDLGILQIYDDTMEFIFYLPLWCRADTSPSPRWRRATTMDVCDDRVIYARA
jgi:hypothetical protein